MRRDQQRLEDILEALDALANLIASRTEEEFLQDETLRYNVAWRLLVVGEAGARISAELKERYPSAPWANMIGLRNILVHQYFGVHWPTVWQSATRDAPALRPQIADIIRLEFEFPPQTG